MIRNNDKGFTLSELLLVVAIIGLLISVAVPVYTTQLEKAREATELSEIRNAYSMALTAAMSSSFDENMGDTDPRNNASGLDAYVGKVVSFTSGSKEYCMSTVKIVKENSDWLSNDGQIPAIGNTDSSQAPTTDLGTTYHYWYILFDCDDMQPYLGAL